MFLKSIGYMAVLLDYIANGLNCPVKTVAERIGEKDLERLCHNAPMNALLPISRIANEIIDHYDFNGSAQFKNSWKNDGLAESYIAAVSEITDDKNQYVHVFFNLITGRKQ